MCRRTVNVVHQQGQWIHENPSWPYGRLAAVLASCVPLAAWFPLLDQSRNEYTAATATLYLHAIKVAPWLLIIRNTVYTANV